MHVRTLGLTLACLVGLAACADTPAQTPPPVAAAAPPAPPPPPTRIRGTIVKLADHTLTVATREGPRVNVTLTDPLTVVTVKNVPLSSISNGTYVGIASRDDAKGTPQALEVLVFPETMRGAGEGHYGWDLAPGSMMTNAAVSGVAKKPAGRDLTLTYKDGSTTVHVPPKAPVVTFAPAARSDLKPGRKVFIIARPDASGNLAAGRLTVATHGVNPPM